MSESCLFCRIASRELSARVVYEDDQCVAFEDINPQAPMHVLVVPRRHIATLNDLADADAPLLGHMVAVGSRIARQYGHHGTGFRAVLNCNAAAGQTVFHIHLHVLGGRNLAWPPG